MSKVEACLFDLDGVIVDTAKYHYLAWKRLAGELGFEFTEQDNERLKGVSRMRSLEILLEVGKLDVDTETKERLADRKNGWYVEYISRMGESEVLPGVKVFLAKLKRAGIKVGLGSASKNAMTIINNIRMYPYFDAIIDGTKVSKAKPDPEVFVRGAQELGVDPSRCIVFEDAEAGVEAAKRAGMGTIGIGYPETLQQADFVIKSFTKSEEPQNADVLAFIFGDHLQSFLRGELPMKRYVELDEWSIIEEGFHPEHQENSESIFSIGNGHMGQRANFEEQYSGNSLQGSYLAGVYYPDKTRVGWWKNGYPEYFAKVLNSTNWIGIDIEINGETLDLAKLPVKEFRRVLDMKEGTLNRSFTKGNWSHSLYRNAAQL